MKDARAFLFINVVVTLRWDIVVPTFEQTLSRFSQLPAYSYVSKLHSVKVLYFFISDSLSNWAQRQLWNLNQIWGSSWEFRCIILNFHKTGIFFQSSEYRSRIRNFQTLYFFANSVRTYSPKLHFLPAAKIWRIWKHLNLISGTYFNQCIVLRCHLSAQSIHTS